MRPKFQMLYLVLHFFAKIIFFSKFMGPFSIIIEPGPNLILFGKTLDMQFQIYTYLSSYSAETENFNFFF